MKSTNNVLELVSENLMTLIPVYESIIDYGKWRTKMFAHQNEIPLVPMVNSIGIDNHLNLVRPASPLRYLFLLKYRHPQRLSGQFMYYITAITDKHMENDFVNLIPLRIRAGETLEIRYGINVEAYPALWWFNVESLWKFAVGMENSNLKVMRCADLRIPDNSYYEKDGELVEHDTNSTTLLKSPAIVAANEFLTSAVENLSNTLEDLTDVSDLTQNVPSINELHASIKEALEVGQRIIQTFNSKGEEEVHENSNKDKVQNKKGK